MDSPYCYDSNNVRRLIFEIRKKFSFNFSLICLAGFGFVIYMNAKTKEDMDRMRRNMN